MSGSDPMAAKAPAKTITERAWSPQGYLAPKGSVEFNNYQAACIAAREVRARAIHSEAHRQSLEAWERGERSWPWPDPTPGQASAADSVVMGLLPDLLPDDELLAISRGHRLFNRNEGRRA